MTRIATTAGALARAGFATPSAAAAVLEVWCAELGADADLRARLVGALARAADPDQALAALERIRQAVPGALLQLAGDARWLGRVAAVLGASSALGQHVLAHPDDLAALAGDIDARGAAVLRAAMLDAVGADPASATPVATLPADGLRLAYRRALLCLAARDLTAADPLAVVEEVGRELADLADAVVEAALAVARSEVPGWEAARLGIVALGKCGAGELNYVSDVDVLYVAEPALGPDGAPLVTAAEAAAVASKLVGSLSRVTSAHSAAGTIWQIDAALRPEGKAGPLVRSLASMRAYYEKWAKNWEFQAMLKARPMAGDRGLAQQFVDMIEPLVWEVGGRDDFVPAVQAMRKRVISLIPPREADAEIKLGAGGLRDTEFSVQLLQLVHGRTDERLRLRGTFEGLRALVACGYVGREDGARLDQAYRFQRALEHRTQLAQLRRTHLFPADEPARRRLARSLRLADAAAVDDAYHASKRRVLRLHQRLFYSPLLEAVARIPTAAVPFTSEAAEVRLRALGYRDPKAALRHIEALTQGVTRSAEIQRQLLPAMLGWFAEGPNPDHGLLAFRQVSEALGRTPWYLRSLRDEGTMAENLARVLASSRYAVDLLMRAPQTVHLLADTAAIRPRAHDEIRAEMGASARRHDDPQKAIAAIRAVRRAELLRLATGDLLGSIDVDALGAGLTDVMGATIDAALEVAARGVPDPPRLAAIALGRWGGRELSYSSDADALFVLADADADAPKKALALIATLRRLLVLPGPDPALEIDLGLRPEGKGGPMVRSLASYRAYYEKWGSTWERQALLRAAPGAGDPELAAEFLAAVEPVRYPVDGLTGRQVTEIRALKARMEAERLPRGTDPKRNVKLGPGGLSDVEWVVQLLQLQHGQRVPAVRSTQTMAALAAEAEAGLVSEPDARVLADAWRWASRIRNAGMLLRGKASDALPPDVRELAPVSELLGYPKGSASEFVEDWHRRARAARRVMDRLFWEAP